MVRHNKRKIKIIKIRRVFLRGTESLAMDLCIRVLLLKKASHVITGNSNYLKANSLVMNCKWGLSHIFTQQSQRHF